MGSEAGRLEGIGEGFVDGDTLGAGIGIVDGLDDGTSVETPEGDIVGS